MKYVLVPFLASVFVMVSPAQQTVDPAVNSHIKDNASFGNQKSPKKEKAATSRTVSGHVTDESGQALPGALVTLTDKKTNEKTNFFTKKDGRYEFADLIFNRDYEVQAKYKDKASPLRKISQYDSAPRPVRTLEIPTMASAASSATAAAAANQPAPPK
jgi:hypothetical protein